MRLVGGALVVLGAGAFLYMLWDWECDQSKPFGFSSLVGFVGLIVACFGGVMMDWNDDSTYV